MQILATIAKINFFRTLDINQSLVTIRRELIFLKRQNWISLTVNPTEQRCEWPHIINKTDFREFFPESHLANRDNNNQQQQQVLDRRESDLKSCQIVSFKISSTEEKKL